MISEKQRLILAFPYSKYNYLICDGAVRSGKTSIMMVAFIDWAMATFNNQRFGICGKTVDSTTKNIIVPYMSLSFAKKYNIRFRRAEKVLEVRRGNKVNWFEVFGGKDESSFTLIQGRTLAGVLLDEVALMPESFVQQALARCSVSGAKAMFSCNPANPSHWFFQNWIKQADERNALYLHFEMEDNPSLSAEVLERYKSMYSGVFYDRYIKGLWVAAEGLVYTVFANEPDKYIIGDGINWLRARDERFARVMIGVDYGGTGSASKFQATGITSSGLVVALEEDYIKGEIDPDGLNKRFTVFVKAITAKYGRSETRADSAEQILIRGFIHTEQTEGLLTTVKNALKLPINDRIMLELLLFRQNRLLISSNCPHLIEAFKTACYDPKKFEDSRLDNGTTDIDSLDAFEYSIEPYYKQLETAGFRRR